MAIAAKPAVATIAAFWELARFKAHLLRTTDSARLVHAHVAAAARAAIEASVIERSLVVIQLLIGRTGERLELRRVAQWR
jgi:hypothetical protein